MGTVSLRIDSDLARQAEREARIENRSKTKQIEHWAKLGKAISSKLTVADAYAVSQGIKIIKLEVPDSVQTTSIDSDSIFDDLESDRASGLLSQKVTSARVYYEASQERPGYLDRVDSATGERKTGSFENGKFKAL